MTNFARIFQSEKYGQICIFITGNGEKPVLEFIYRPKNNPLHTFQKEYGDVEKDFSNMTMEDAEKEVCKLDEGINKEPSKTSCRVVITQRPEITIR